MSAHVGSAKTKHIETMKNIDYQGTTLLYAGKGNCAGSHSYSNVSTGEVATIYDGMVINTGPAFSIISVLGNQALQTVFLSRQVLGGLALGQKVLVGPIDYSHASGPRALGAWMGMHTASPKRVPVPLPPAPQPVLQPRLERGTIASVAATGTYGRIIADLTGESVFLAGSQLAPGLALRPGLRVKFVRSFNAKGPAASQVTLAA